MSKVLELVMISVLLISAFFFGVSYSGPVRENFSWLFEVKEQEVEIPEVRKQQNIAKTIEIKNTTTEISDDSDESNQIGQN